VSIKGIFFQSFRVKTEGYSADLLLRAGLQIKVTMLLMTRPGYFLLIIKPNSKLKLQVMHYSIEPMVCVTLEVVVIFISAKMHAIEVIIIQT
jgi:hypothetical protein